MRIAFTAALLAAAVAATADPIAHKDVTGYWGNSTDNVIWRNSYGECWRTGTWTREQAVAACEGGAPAPAPVRLPHRPRRLHPPRHRPPRSIPTATA